MSPRFPSPARLRKLPILILTLLLVFSQFPAQAARPAAGSTIPSPILDPNSVGWASFRNLTSAQFSDKFTEFADAGYMVIDIEVDEIDGTQRVGAVWQRNLDGRGWAEWRNQTTSEFAATKTELTAAGYRLIDQEAYQLDGRWLYAGAWIQNKEELGWVSYLDVTSADFSTFFDRYTAAGYMMIDVDAYPTADGLRYAAVWVENSEMLGWVEWRDLTSSEFAEKFQEYQNTYRMIDVESYAYNGTQYYAGIWVENVNGRGWAEWRDMTSKQFGDKWIELRDAGYRLINYEVYNTANGWRYAGVWRQNSERPNWRLKDQVDAYLEGQAALYDIPGMSVAIMDSGQFVYLRGFGFADIDDQVYASSTTIYRLASISKAVGGVLSLRLENQTPLNLDSPSSTYIPGLPAMHTHTVRQTVANRSGIGHYEDYPSISGNYPTALGAAQDLWNTPLAYTPGNGYKYSTHAYTFLGASLEGASGLTIGNIVLTQLTTPYGLSSLRQEDRSVPNAQRATLYNTSNAEVTADDLSWKVLGGGLESSAYDLARFGGRLLDGSLLSPADLTELWTPPDGFSNYALGWSTGTESGTPVVAKDGAQNGARSYLRMYPDEGIVIAVLTNRKGGGHSPVTIGREIGKLMLALVQQNNLSAPQEPAPQAPAAEEIDEPGEEVTDPALVVYPVESPTANPTRSDLEEPGFEAPIVVFDTFIPLVIQQ